MSARKRARTTRDLEPSSPSSAAAAAGGSALMAAAPAPETVAALVAQTSTVDLKYGIHSWSSYSAKYHPRHIMENKPYDQASRWSSGCNTQAQFIMLELPHPAIVKEVTFGKFEKGHVCNLKEFKVFGGMKTENMVELVNNGLRNDNQPETFRTTHTVRGVVFPCKFIKIVPILAWGQNFNFSVWYVGLRGIADSIVVDAALNSYQALRERESIRLCLKHLRQRNLLSCFKEVQKASGVELESPYLTELYDTIVLEGNFQRAEELVSQSATADVLREYLSSLPYTPTWTLLTPVDSDAMVTTDVPGMRGGHQMCIDSELGLIFLLGGWDGKKDLSDMWQYSIRDNRWELLSADTATCGGPGPRSCHKLAINTRTKQIWVLGQYVEPQSRNDMGLHGDLYCYYIHEKRWEMVSNNTLAEGGPGLIYDHQMCVDSENEVLYVFGGSTLIADQSAYSGLYSYDCRAGTWEMLREDQGMGKGYVKLPSRIGHSMLFDPSSRQLYIFAGQRNKDYLNDFYKYNIDDDIVEQVCRDSSTQGGPDPGFTQRATIDPVAGELYILSGLARQKLQNKPEKEDDTVNNSFWVYNFKADKWCCAYQNDNSDPAYWSKMHHVEPRPRYAHQLVFDSVNKVHYLFGGNPGNNIHKETRLSDFWSLKLTKPSRELVLKHCCFALRKQSYLEMCSTDPRGALRYLQGPLADVVDHDDEAQSASFRELASSLFMAEKGPAAAAAADMTQYAQRIAVFEKLLTYYPAEAKQPEKDLIDLPILC